MLAPSAQRWPAPSEVEGILFFAQLVEEMLFDYSLDSYSVPALNTRLRCIELLSNVVQIEEGAIKDIGGLASVTEELRSSLKNDFIAKNLLRPYYERFIKQLDPSKKNLVELKKYTTHIIKILNSSYLKKTKEAIIEKIQTPEKKEDISLLAQSFVTEILATGCTQQTAYFLTRSFFFGGYSDPITSTNKVKEYFGRFSFLDEKVKAWKVVFKASSDWIHLDKLANEGRLEISKVPPSLPKMGKMEKAFYTSDENFPVYISIFNIEAMEANQARLNARGTLETLRSIAHYLDHNANLTIYKHTLIYLMENDKVFSLKDPVSASRKQPNLPRRELPLRIREIIDLFYGGTIDEDTYSKIYGALEMHAAALNATRPQEQLLNLWSAIESIVPRSQSNIIENVVSNITPILCLRYLEGLLQYFITCLKFKKKREIIRLINEPEEGQNELQKCACFLGSEKYKSQREKAYALLSDDPLMKHRISILHDKISEPKYFLETIKAHDEKLIWHLRRIYRMRNMIIHAGMSMPYLEILVENIHCYFDTMMKEIRDRLVRRKSINTIDMIFWEIRTDYTLWKKKIKQLDDFAPEDFPNIVLSLPSSPDF